MVMHARRSRGFTLVEMLVGVAVVSILLTAAGPSLSDVITAQQVKNAGFDLSAALVVARSEALTRNVSVTLAPNSAENWALGWVVRDEGGNVLRRQNPYPRITASGPTQVIFNSDGRPDSTATPFAFTAPAVAPDNARCVRVRLNGRPAIAKGGC